MGYLGEGLAIQAQHGLGLSQGLDGDVGLLNQILETVICIS